MRRTFLRTLAGAAAVATLLGAAACASSDETGGDSAAECQYKIAMMGPITGDAAGLGAPILNAVKLAVKQHNEKNADKCVTLVESDDKGTEDEAPGLAQNLVADSTVLGVVGPAFSGPTSASGDIFQGGNLPIISGSATRPDLSEKGWSIFHRTLGNDATQGPAAAKFISETLKAEKVFVIDDKSDYGTGLAEQVKTSLGDTVVGSESIQQKQTDFSGVVASVRTAAPDAVFFGGYYAEGGPLAQQLKAGGVDAQFIGADGIKDQGFITGAQDAAEGAIITCPCIPPDQATGTFTADYTAEFGEAPGTYAPESFDAANVFLSGIASGVTDRQAMLDYIGTYDADGASKHIKFDDKGEIEASAIVIWAYEVKGDAITPLQQI